MYAAQDFSSLEDNVPSVTLGLGITALIVSVTLAIMEQETNAINVINLVAFAQDLKPTNARPALMYL